MSEDAALTLTLDRLYSAVAGKAAAFRIVTRLGPAGGEGDKLFPPTYKHPDRDASTYAVETRRLDGRERRGSPSTRTRKEGGGEAR
jgi:CRISPR-associated protein Csb1